MGLIIEKRKDKTPQQENTHTHIYINQKKKVVCNLRYIRRTTLPKAERGGNTPRPKQRPNRTEPNRIEPNLVVGAPLRHGRGILPQRPVLVLVLGQKVRHFYRVAHPNGDVVKWLGLSLQPAVRNKTPEQRDGDGGRGEKGVHAAVN